MIKLEKVSAGYGKKEVLKNVTLSLEKGKVTAILGPNGCGKSTLLKTILGFQEIFSGKVKIDGRELTQFVGQELARKVSYLPQKKGAPDISVLRMVLHGRFPYLSYPRRYGKRDYEIAKEALQWAGLEDIAQENVSRLSGGTQQKVYIAMALAQDTPYILLDEPTTYLDISHQWRTMELAKELAAEGKTVGIVIHDIAMALRMADEIVVLNQGRVAEKGSPEEVYASGILEEVFEVNVKRVDTENGWQYYYG